MKQGKKGVSPVIATILLIALVVSAAAIVYFVVIPMLGTDANVIADDIDFSDTNANFLYDEVELNIANSGTKIIYPKEINIRNIGQEINVTWQLTSQGALKAGTGGIFTALTITEGFEIISGKRVDIYLSFSPDVSTSQPQEQFIGSKFLPLLVNATADIYMSMAYRTSAEDCSTSRGTFPGPGYSPTLYFLLGAYRSSPSLSTDYILQSTGNTLEQDYRPYLNDTYTFETGDPYDSEHRFMAYNDTGSYTGLIGFYGNRFDENDDLDWKGSAVVYVSFYIYNPTLEDMDVQLFYQCDDHAKIYANGQALSIVDPSWNKWSNTGYDLIIEPGYTYFLFKCQDTGGNFDGQVLFVDSGETDQMNKLQSRWPVYPPAPLNPTDPDALRYRGSSDDSGTSSSTFPGPGYSPQKWFILGRVVPDVNAQPTGNMLIDYIALNGYGTEETYRPYLGSGDVFNTEVGTETGNSFMAYMDAGNHIGVLDFIPGRFDSGDTFEWSDDGIVYAATYIYNPDESAADVAIACQSDDYFILWVNGNKIFNGTETPLAWNAWCPLQNITLNPGLNYILVKSGDKGGNWDVNLILHDVGTSDDLSTFTAIWPETNPTLSPSTRYSHSKYEIEQIDIYSPIAEDDILFETCEETNIDFFISKFISIKKQVYSRKY